MKPSKEIQELLDLIELQADLLEEMRNGWEVTCEQKEKILALQKTEIKITDKYNL